ncbi:MAG: DUF86 domain-containing protein [Clostridia bacterium]|nr:MAG: DUF86 domain-containing protein [Clostridia bacterium]
MTVDTEKVRQKLHFMRTALRQLKELQGISLEAFQENRVYPAAAAYTLQTAIEAMLDLCAHIISREGWGLPKSYREAVIIAARNGLIPEDTLPAFEAMARLRNRLVHLYDQVDDHELWKIIQENLDDFKPFIAGVVRRYCGR